MQTPRRLAVIACEVFTREVCAEIAVSPCEIGVNFLPKGLHSLPCAMMRAKLQQAIDGVDPLSFDGIALAYGMCNNALGGLCAGALPIALPRAHDCIGVFLGSVQRHRATLEEEPGTYFQSTGWVEHGDGPGPLSQSSITHRNRMDLDRAQLVERYGEDNADYLMSQLAQAEHYHRCTFIHTGADPGQHSQQAARKRAQTKGWEFREVASDLVLLRNLLHGAWDHPGIVVVPPGQRLAMCYDDRVAIAEPQPGR